MRHALHGLLLLLAPSMAWGQTFTSVPTVPRAPKSALAQVLNATGAITIASNAASVSNSVTLYTCATANGQASKIKGVVAGSTDGTARDLQVLLVNTSKVYVLGIVTIPINAGNVAGTPTVDVLAPSVMPGLPVDSDGMPYIQCGTGDSIVVGTKVAPTSNAAITVWAQVDDY